MNQYENCLKVMDELFGKDFQFSLATVKDDTPSVRVIDTYYENESFYIVTYGNSQKVKDIESNQKVSICNNLYRFNGDAHNIGHPLKPENHELRDKLIKEFEPWYFAHNNENDEAMCYVKIDIKDGFFYKDGKGYQVNFVTKEVNEFPFTFDLGVI